MGNITELMTMLKPCNGSPCRKIDKDHYMDTRTGEVFEYNHTENRAGSRDSIRRTLSDIRALINTNVTVPAFCRWVTLTYAENMTDTKKLYKDYKNFWERFCTWCKSNGHSKPEYIVVVEPQGRGAWHIHAFFIWDSKAPFIPNDELAKVWGQGFTKIKTVDDCDNPGAYFSAYLGDMPLDEVDKLSLDDKKRAFDSSGFVEQKEFTDEQGNIKEKKFVKGARLFLYPVGMNIKRCSSGIKKATVEHMSRFDAEKKVSSAKETFSRSYEILDDAGAVVNVISKAYYNSKR